MLPGKGQMQTTGKLGDVMKESIAGGALATCKLARRQLRHQADRCSRRRDIHVHVPEGATPKDGPSAGVAMVDLDRLGADRHSGARATSR